MAAVVLVPATSQGASTPRQQAGGAAPLSAGHDAGEAVDLNTATWQQLASLPGMGPNYARRVIDGRPYLAKNQLVNRGILPQGAYQAIKDRVVAHRTAAMHRAVENSASKGLER